MQNYVTQALFLGNLSDALHQRLGRDVAAPSEDPKKAKTRKQTGNYIERHFKEPNLEALKGLSLEQKIARVADDSDYRSMQAMHREVMRKEREILKMGNEMRKKLDGTKVVVDGTDFSRRKATNPQKK